MLGAVSSAAREPSNAVILPDIETGILCTSGMKKALFAPLSISAYNPE